MANSDAGGWPSHHEGMTAGHPLAPRRRRPPGPLTGPGEARAGVVRRLTQRRDGGELLQARDPVADRVEGDRPRRPGRRPVERAGQAEGPATSPVPGSRRTSSNWSPHRRRSGAQQQRAVPGCEYGSSVVIGRPRGERARGQHEARPPGSSPCSRPSAGRRTSGRTRRRRAGPGSRGRGCPGQDPGQPDRPRATAPAPRPRPGSSSHGHPRAARSSPCRCRSGPRTRSPSRVERLRGRPDDGEATAWRSRARRRRPTSPRCGRSESERQCGMLRPRCRAGSDVARFRAGAVDAGPRGRPGLQATRRDQPAGGRAHAVAAHRQPRSAASIWPRCASTCQVGRRSRSVRRRMVAPSGRLHRRRSCRRRQRPALVRARAAGPARGDHVPFGEERAECSSKAVGVQHGLLEQQSSGPGFRSRPAQVTTSPRGPVGASRTSIRSVPSAAIRAPAAVAAALAREPPQASRRTPAWRGHGADHRSARHPAPRAQERAIDHKPSVPPSWAGTARRCYHRPSRVPRTTAVQSIRLPLHRHPRVEQISIERAQRLEPEASGRSRLSAPPARRVHTAADAPHPSRTLPPSMSTSSPA